MNTGSLRVRSRHGLITTLGTESIRKTPCIVWKAPCRGRGARSVASDNLGIIAKAPEVEELARTVEDNGGSTLFRPSQASLLLLARGCRGVIAGLTRFVNKGHMARAVLEASAFQTKDIVESMNQDSGVALRSLKVDGGMVTNELLMQFQADLLNVPVIRPKITKRQRSGRHMPQDSP